MEVCHVCYGYRLVQSPAGVVTQLLDVQYSSIVSNYCGGHLLEKQEHCVTVS